MFHQRLVNTIVEWDRGRYTDEVTRSGGGVDSSFAQAAVAALNEAGLDTVGDGFEKGTVELVEGGE